MSEPKSISVDILSFEEGAEHFEEIKAVRIISKHYNLLIMVDYMPLIGEIEGDLALVKQDGEEIRYKGVTGFYRHSKNQFEFILKGRIKNAPENTAKNN